MTARRNPRMLAAARLLENYATVVQAALDHLHEERRAIDWHPASTLGDGTPRGTTDDSPVERTCAAIVHIDGQIAQLTDDMGTIAAIIASAMTVANDYLGTRAPTIKPTLCDSTGREGAIEWADPNCTDLPVRGSLCARCNMRERRWRMAHGLDAREDTFA